MLKSLISTYGKQKLNSFTKYPSIPTLHKMEKGVLTEEIADGFPFNEKMYATEKVDGTNVRILCYHDEMIIGSRENLLWHNEDLFFDPAQGIVAGLAYLSEGPAYYPRLTAFYGEFYGGKVSSGSKNSTCSSKLVAGLFLFGFSTTTSP